MNFLNTNGTNPLGGMNDPFNPKNLKKLMIIGLVKKALLLALILLPDLLSGQSPYHFQRKSLFEVLPVTSKDIVFLGNSITDGGEWMELFNDRNIKNRGISGDQTQDVLSRLSQVTDGQPRKIFLLIGINDLNDNPANTDKAINNIRLIIERIQSECPKTKLYVQSIMPVDERRPAKAKELIKANAEIKKICGVKGVTYIDLHPALADENGNLRADYSNDGLHLMGAGYQAWANAIRKYVK